MNRIQNFVDDELETLVSPPLLSSSHTDEQLPPQDAHCIITPLHYERNYAYPLVVWLHGPGDDERQVTRIMPHVSTRNYAAVGPRGTVAMEDSAGYRWTQSPPHIARAERRVLAAVSAARNWLNIEPSRIFLAGFGCGGTMAFRIALSHPHVFRSVLSFGGPMPTRLQPLAHLDAARGLKTFVATGVDSQQYSQVEVCRDLRLLHSAGMSLCLRLYPCADELLTNMLSDMDRWIMAQLTSRNPFQADEVSQRSPRR